LFEEVIETMQSLIKKAPQACCAPKVEVVAQCCAKVSKTVAGCHD
jgi:hypothetical protein